MSSKVATEHDRYLTRPTPGPDAPSSSKPELSQEAVDRHHEEQYAQEQAALREQEQVREQRRMERRRAAAVGIVITFGDRTYRGALPPQMDSTGLEGHSAGQLIGRLLAAAQARQLLSLEAAERAALDPPELVHGPIRRDGRMEPCPCSTKSCLFAAEARGWADRVSDLARTLAGMGLLEETT